MFHSHFGMGGPGGTAPPAGRSCYQPSHQLILLQASDCNMATCSWGIYLERRQQPRSAAQAT